jgi:hypothetical protein
MRSLKTVPANAPLALNMLHETLKEERARDRRRAVSRRKNIRHNAKMLTRIVAALPEDVDLEIYGNADSTVPLSDCHLEDSEIVLHAKREDLPKIRKALGALHYRHKSLTQRNGVDMCQVDCTLEKYPDMIIRYVRPLPECGPCHVEVQTSTYRTLVCSRS